MKHDIMSEQHGANLQQNQQRRKTQETETEL